MDPLSITSAVIAICGVIRQTTICCQKLRALRKAPAELANLLEEVTSLQDLLQELEIVAHAAERANRDQRTSKAASIGGLGQHLERTSAKLRELDSLVYKHAQGEVRFGINRGHWGWSGGRSRANALREDLQGLRLNLATSLQASNWHQNDRIESALEHVSSQQDETRKQLTAFVHWFISQVSQAPQLIPSFTKTIDCTFNISVEGSSEVNPGSEKSLNLTSTMTRLQKTRIQETTTTVQVCAPESNSHCKAWCSCLCHLKNVIRIKHPFSKAVGGSFSLAYSGLPYITAGCDQKSCRSRSQPSVYMTIQFPSWLWQRCVATSMDCNPLAGPNLNVRMPRVVGFDSKLWKYGPTSDIGAIQRLYSAKSASPMDVSPLGGNALHYAAGHGQFKMCEFLINEGALKDQEDDFNNTATSLAWDQILSKSLTENDEQLAIHIFNNPEYLQSRQFTVLHKIVLGLVAKDLESDLVCSTKEIDCRDSTGRTCVSWAAARGDLGKLGTLLRHGADANLSDIQGSSPLHFVRDRACAELLVQHKADVKARNDWGHTPLHAVTRNKGSLAVLDTLVQAGADINATDYSCETALCNGSVAIEQHIQCATYLITHGADIEAATDSKDTLLHLATMYDAHAILRLLLAQGADYTRQNKYGQNIMHLAARLSNLETIKIFKNQGLPKIDTHTVDSEGKTAMDYLADRSANANALEVGFDTTFRDLVQSTSSDDSVAISELTGELAAVDLTKDGGVHVCLTPFSGMSDDDDDGYDYEYNDFDDRSGDAFLDDQELPVFHDAVESMDVVLPVQIAV